MSRRAPAGIAAADAFLKRAVPPILRSPAYHASGALFILFSDAPANQAAGARSPRTGALVLSPAARADSTDAARYDAYSVLHTIEDIFGLSTLGHARPAPAFDRRVFSATPGTHHG